MNNKSRYYKRPPEYTEWQRNYARKYTKTAKYKARRKKWLHTVEGRRYKANAANRRSRRHRIWVDAYKMKKGCIDCGFKKWPEALDFDHKDRKSKKFVISQRMGWSKEYLLREIKKCVVRCSNCHRHKTKEANPNGFLEKLPVNL